MKEKKPDDREKARVWLNEEPELLATFAWNASDKDYATVSLRDCSRSITLDFHPERDLKTAIDKIDLLINGLREFRRVVIKKSKEKK